MLKCFSSTGVLTGLNADFFPPIEYVSTTTCYLILIYSVVIAVSSPKRRELDKVMKKARRDGPTQSNYWNKKLLEAEEKDPNRYLDIHCFRIN